VPKRFAQCWAKFHPPPDLKVVTCRRLVIAKDQKLVNTETWTEAIIHHVQEDQGSKSTNDQSGGDYISAHTVRVYPEFQR
jgi:hypothetical protein